MPKICYYIKILQMGDTILRSSVGGRLCSSYLDVYLIRQLAYFIDSDSSGLDGYFRDHHHPARNRVRYYR